MADTPLLERVARGDRDAFVDFYEQFAPRVFALLMCRFKERRDAEDVLQETFWQVWQTAKCYDPSRSTPQTWLFLLARSRASDHARRHGRGQPASAEELLAEESDPFEHLARTEIAERVRGALGHLPSEQRDAVRLAFFEGLSHRQIAEHLGIPLGTVKTRILLAMRRLRMCLHADNPKKVVR